MCISLGQSRLSWPADTSPKPRLTYKAGHLRKLCLPTGCLVFEMTFCFGPEDQTRALCWLTCTGCMNSHRVTSPAPITSSFIDIICNNMKDKTGQDDPRSCCYKMEGYAFTFISCILSLSSSESPNMALFGGEVLRNVIKVDQDHLVGSNMPNILRRKRDWKTDGQVWTWVKGRVLRSQPTSCTMDSHPQNSKTVFVCC